MAPRPAENEIEGKKGVKEKVGKRSPVVVKEKCMWMGVGLCGKEKVHSSEKVTLNKMLKANIISKKTTRIVCDLNLFVYRLIIFFSSFKVKSEI